MVYNTRNMKHVHPAILLKEHFHKQVTLYINHYERCKVLYFLLLLFSVVVEDKSCLS